MSVPYTDSEASEARQWSNRYGPPNAWTASFGTAARMIGRLLDERERLMADAMLRERSRSGKNSSGGTDSAAKCTERDSANHDAAPERGDALAYDEAAARLLYERDSANDELSLLRRAVRQLLDGVNERHPEKPPREWVCNDMALLDRLVPPNHDASPEAIASVESVAPQPTTRGDSDRTDKAAQRPSEGTGDTPDSPKPIKGGVSDRSKPINGPDPDSRVWETPVHTPAPHATPGDGSVPRECTEPEAWAVCCPNDGDWSPCFFHEPHAQRCANAIFGSKNIVPLYRKTTLTAAEREDMECAASRLQSDPNGPRDLQVADTLRGLLARLGGGE